MKKKIALTGVLALTIALSLCACGKKNEAENTSSVGVETASNGKGKESESVSETKDAEGGFFDKLLDNSEDKATKLKRYTFGTSYVNLVSSKTEGEDRNKYSLYKTSDGENFCAVSVVDINTLENPKEYEGESYPIRIMRSETSSISNYRIPDGVLIVGKFYNITSIGPVGSGADLELPDSVLKIDDSAFADIKELKSVVIPDGVIEIGILAFNDSRIETLILPDSIEIIGDKAFRRVEITELVLPKNLKTMGEGIFTSASNLKNLTIPEGITQISDSAFFSCSIENLVLPESLEVIGDFAFSHNNVTEITIPKNIQSLGWGAFSNCDNLSAVTFDDGCSATLHQESLGYCDALTEISIPDNVNAHHAFSYDDNLTSITYKGNTFSNYKEFEDYMREQEIND